VLVVHYRNKAITHQKAADMMAQQVVKVALIYRKKFSKLPCTQMPKRQCTI